VDWSVGGWSFKNELSVSAVNCSDGLSNRLSIIIRRYIDQHIQLHASFITRSRIIPAQFVSLQIWPYVLYDPVRRQVEMALNSSLYLPSNKCNVRKVKRKITSWWSVTMTEWLKGMAKHLKNWESNDSNPYTLTHLLTYSLHGAQTFLSS